MYVVVGDPVDQVRAPRLLNAEFSRRGVDAVLVPLHVPAARFLEVAGALRMAPNVDGMLVTVPHKLAVCRLADEVSAAVALTGSANILRRGADGRWQADNFDGAGFVDGLAAAGHSVRGRRLLLVGCGGAGVAMAVALLESGVDHLFVRERDESRLEAVLSRLAAHWPARITAHRSAALPDVDFAVNATPLGLRPDDPLPFEPAALPAHTVVADIVMKPLRTPLLATAEALGHPVHHGAHMLDRQIARYLDFFLDRPDSTTGTRSDEPEELDERFR
ncbi:shikimate dehydrogenase family protein [Dactylosporangium sp. CA-152071]|uniref:shikimate dehydrogenase family protein n=1 Tax=Dactylosporangium sp. CA-152071 TaxID=3239933 RepID=UPI003D8C1584